MSIRHVWMNDSNAPVIPSILSLTVTMMYIFQNWNLFNVLPIFYLIKSTTHIWACISYCIRPLQAGLYEKWTGDTLDETRRNSRTKHRKLQQQQQQQQQEYERPGDEAQLSSSSSSRALTLVHMQGPLLLLLLGLVSAGLTFTIEIITVRCDH